MAESQPPVDASNNIIKTDILTSGYLRQEIENQFKIFIPHGIKKICYKYWFNKALREFDFIKLWRFGRTVTGTPGWLIRATQSKISFYQLEDKKIRIVAKEQDSNKLRMNQNVPIPSNSSFKSPRDRLFQWTAKDITDATITAEEKYDGFSSWLIKFESTEIRQEFKNEFEKASKFNDQ